MYLEISKRSYLGSYHSVSLCVLFCHNDVEMSELLVTYERLTQSPYLSSYARMEMQQLVSMLLIFFYIFLCQDEDVGM